MRKLGKIFFVLYILLTLFIVGCKEKTHVVVFNYNYNSITTTREVENGNTVSKPQNPTRDRYEFVGWYEDSNLTIEFDETQKISSNKTIYAKWNPVIVYSIDYVLNGGKFVGDLVTNFVDPSDVTLPTATKEHYEFLGWYEDGKKVETIEAKNYYLTAKYAALYDSVDPLSFSPIREETKIYLDVTYKIVGGEELKLDLYLPPLKENETCPVLFMYYGGGFISGDKSDVASSNGGSGYLQDIFDYALDNGVAVVIPNYRLSNGNTVTFPSPVEDSLDAIRFCVKNSAVLGIDVNNMGSIGYSAGAYMALMTAFAQDYFQGDPDLKSTFFRMKYVVDLFGPSYYDSEELSKLSVIGMVMLSNFLGGGNYNDSEAFSSTMPSYYAGYNSPDVYIIHGNMDTLVPCSQSEKLHNLFISKNINSTYLVVENAEHGLGPAKSNLTTSLSTSEIAELIENFINTEIKK